MGGPPDFKQTIHPQSKPKWSADPIIRAAEHFDWGQPGAAWAPCFHLGNDGHFCGRAPFWDGHRCGSSHHYVSLADLIRNMK